MNSLLPPNVTELEQALEAVTDRATDLPAPLRETHRPADCPEQLLPALAWSLSVDEWDRQWPEAARRRVIAASPTVHRLKGTVGAVRRAIAALGATVDISEWWQTGGPVHTAQITAYAGENLSPDGDTLLTPKLQAQLWNVVEKTKPERSHIEFKVGVRIDAGATVAAATMNTTYQHRSPVTHLPDVPTQAAAAVASAAQAITINALSGTATAAVPLRTAGHLAAIGSHTTVNRISGGFA